MDGFLKLMHDSVYDPIKKRNIKLILKEDGFHVKVGGYLCLMKKNDKKEKVVELAISLNEDGNYVLAIRKKEDKKFMVLPENELSELKFNFSNKDY